MQQTSVFIGVLVQIGSRLVRDYLQCFFWGNIFLEQKWERGGAGC